MLILFLFFASPAAGSVQTYDLPQLTTGTCLPTNFTTMQDELSLESRIGKYQHRLTEELFSMTTYNFFSDFEVAQFPSYAKLRWYSASQNAVHMIYDKCLQTLQSVMGCVKQLNYDTHYIHHMPKVRNDWMVCKFFNSEDKMEKLKEMVNRKLPAAIDDAKNRLKDSMEYQQRVNLRVEAKIEALVTELLKDDVAEMQKDFDDFKAMLQEKFKRSQALFVREFIDYMRSLKEENLTPLPPTDRPPVFKWTTRHPWHRFTEPLVNEWDNGGIAHNTLMSNDNPWGRNLVFNSFGDQSYNDHEPMIQFGPQPQFGPVPEIQFDSQPQFGPAQEPQFGPLPQFGQVQEPQFGPQSQFGPQPRFGAAPKIQFGPQPQFGQEPL